MEIILSAIQQTDQAIGIVDVSGNIIYSNKAFAEMHGYQLQEITGINLSCFHREDDMPQVLAANQQVLETGSFKGEITRMHRNGSIFPTLMQSSLVRDESGAPAAIVGTVWDISKELENIRDLKETRAFLGNILDAIPDVIGIQDAEHRVISYNAAGYEFLGTTHDQIQGRKCYELIGHSVPCAKCATSLTYKSLKPERIEKYVPEMGRWLDVRSYPILNEAGELVKVIEHLRDITDRKEAELKNKRLEKQVRTTQKLESLGVLAGGIAHDFNNILMSVLGNADLALCDNDPESVRSHLREIVTASRRAADLAGQMLDYSGKSDPYKTPVDVNRILTETAVMLGVSVSRKTTLEYCLQEELPSVLADPVQLQQVIMNLITNASEALENSPGNVTLSTAVETCRACDLSETYVNDDLPSGKYVVIRVGDNGSGMSAATLSRIFDPFFTTKFTGRGLGLAAVLGIIRAHYGAVSVSSQEGSGTVFSIYLPVAKDDTPISQEDSAEKECDGTGSILVVDDEDAVRMVTGKMLNKLGYRIEFASNGREAVEIFSKTPGRYDCVLLDLTMPVMDGLEASRKIRSIRSDAKIIISSGFTRDAIMKEFADLSISGILHKPYSLDEISHVVRKVLAM